MFYQFSSFTSGTTCTIVHVDDNPIQATPDASHPPPNGAIDTDAAFVIRFNDQVEISKANRCSLIPKSQNPYVRSHPAASHNDVY